MGELAVASGILLFPQIVVLACSHVAVPLILSHSTHVPPRTADSSEEKGALRDHDCSVLRVPPVNEWYRLGDSRSQHGGARQRSWILEKMGLDPNPK